MAHQPSWIQDDEESLSYIMEIARMSIDAAIDLIDNKENTAEIIYLLKSVLETLYIFENIFTSMEVENSTLKWELANHDYFK